VGTDTCALAVCDVDGSRAVTASAALRIPSKAVGQLVSLNCGCVVTATTRTRTTATTMPPAVILHLENISAQSMEVWIDTDFCMRGYQFTVSGATLAGAVGGLTHAAGLSVSAGATLVLAVPPGLDQRIDPGSSGELIQMLLSDSSGFVCTGLWVVVSCDANATSLPAASIYFRRVDGSLCRSDQPGCFLCNF